MNQPDQEFDLDGTDTTVEVEILLPQPTDTVCLPPEMLTRYSNEYKRILAEREVSDENLCLLHQRSLENTDKGVYL